MPTQLQQPSSPFLLLTMCSYYLWEVSAHGSHHKHSEGGHVKGASHHSGSGHNAGTAYSQEGVSLDQAKIRLEQLRSGRVLDDSEEQHIREHLESIAKLNEGEMTDEERGLHFFYLHDMDSDTKLDGLEILHSIMEVNHGKEESEEDNSNQSESHQDQKEETNQGAKEDKAKEEANRHDPRHWSLNEIVEHIDSLLRDYDKNNDGYLDYYEFKALMGQNKERREEHEKRQKEKQDSEL